MLQGYPQESTFDVEYLEPVLPDLICSWYPDLSGNWRYECGPNGPLSATQSWFAPKHELLPIAMRQMVSWNRDRFSYWNSFTDIQAPYFGNGGTPTNRLVPVSASIVPVLQDSHPTVIADFMKSPYLIAAANGADTLPCQMLPNTLFPSMHADMYRLDVTWAPDEFINRFGIKYAKVEIEPTIRMESITGASMGVVKLDAAGDIVLEPDGDPKAAERITTGFPSREPQILIKLTYPWVRLGGDGGNVNVKARSILAAGPLGRTLGIVNLLPGQVPLGQYLGCVNSDWFLGFPRGRVLYQSASLVEKVSPVTGRLGYQITHDFLCMSNAEWNQVRMQKVETDVVLAPNADAETAQWPYGFSVATDKNGSIILTGAVPPAVGQPVFPYVYKSFEPLLYYGYESDFPPSDEG